MDVSENSGTPKSSISIGFSTINHPFWGTPILGKHPYVYPKQPPGLFFIAQLVFFQHSDSPEFIKPPKGLELEAPPSVEVPRSF